MERFELNSYIAPVVYCPATSAFMVGMRYLSLRKIAAMKSLMDQIKINRGQLSYLELKKPFLKAYWETFERAI